jgi:hypothetical protein
MPAADQRFREVAPDETGAAGDENLELAQGAVSS